MLEYKVGLATVVEVNVTGDERSNTCEAKGQRKVKSTQVYNTTRFNVQDDNADGHRNERRDLSVWVSLAKRPAVGCIVFRQVENKGRRRKRDVHQSSTLCLFSGPLCMQAHLTFATNC